jgi:hypothetical protein
LVSTAGAGFRRRFCSVARYGLVSAVVIVRVAA